MISQDILANFENDDDYNSWMDTLNSEALSYESPFAVKQETSAGQKSALEISNSYMALKQRKQMVMEFYKKDPSTGEINLKSMTMYINPEKMQITNQKVIGSVKTRGGIFYHHWGNDNAVMSLSGTTGLAGMAGIKQLEEVYFASGTLLRYNNYLPTQVYGNITDYTTLDYSDPVSVVTSATNSSTSSSTIDKIKENLLDTSQNELTDSNQIYNCTNYLSVYASNKTLQEFINEDLPDIYNEVEDWSETSKVYYRKYFQKILNKLNDLLPNMSNDIKVNIAYELSLKRLYSNLSDEDAEDAINDTDTSTLTAMVNLQDARANALSDYLSQIQDDKTRNAKIRDILRNGFTTLTDELKDEWLPRKITIYFETRAYVGHFESFNYNRDAQTNLISYDMRFVIEKQYQFNNGEDDSDSLDNSIAIGASIGAAATKSSKQTYIVTGSDSMDTIAKKFYGDEAYWPEIYAANLDTMVYADTILLGQELNIPELPKNYWNWVVLADGETVSYIAKRFYGDYSKTQPIIDANRDIITNPDYLYFRTLLKVPKL
jgi:hypothetical protein